jgi:hypothetical protein
MNHKAAGYGVIGLMSVVVINLYGTEGSNGTFYDLK